MHETSTLHYRFFCNAYDLQTNGTARLTSLAYSHYLQWSHLQWFRSGDPEPWKQLLLVPKTEPQQFRGETFHVLQKWHRQKYGLNILLNWLAWTEKKQWISSTIGSEGWQSNQSLWERGELTLIFTWTRENLWKAVWKHYRNANKMWRCEVEMYDRAPTKFSTDVFCSYVYFNASGEIDRGAGQDRSWQPDHLLSSFWGTILT